ncbi:unnamed protein product [Strongylus vulgaris]|uniref:Uncharacterized protein n=1 Tax=Strongylus vulgaris TaxID=40348 RepID=A0A3P7KZ28_STRVU|nr:unnamed protein product [Strongylus vulgaris]
MEAGVGLAVILPTQRPQSWNTRARALAGLTTPLTQLSIDERLRATSGQCSSHELSVAAFSLSSTMDAYCDGKCEFSQRDYEAETN